jgi:hypothetical protein
MMVTVFLWTNNINVPCKTPPMFLRVKFGKKSGGNTRVNTVMTFVGLLHGQSVFGGYTALVGSWMITVRLLLPGSVSYKVSGVIGSGR